MASHVRFYILFFVMSKSLCMYSTGARLGNLPKASSVCATHVFVCQSVAPWTRGLTQ